MIPTETWVLPRPRRDAYVGSFPLHFEQKFVRLIAELQGKGDWEFGHGTVLHPFGGLAEIGDTVDLNATTSPTFVGDAHDMHWIVDNSYDLVLLDPPYSDDESHLLYRTPPLRYGQFIREAVRVCKPGGHVAIYHKVMKPRPAGCRLVHRVVVLTRVNHAARICMVYQKMTPEQAEAFARQMLSDPAGSL